MKLSTDSWHFKYYNTIHKTLLGYQADRPRDLCTYVWSVILLTFGTVISFPFLLLGYVFRPVNTKLISMGGPSKDFLPDSHDTRSVGAAYSFFPMAIATYLLGFYTLLKGFFGIAPIGFEKLALTVFVLFSIPFVLIFIGYLLWLFKKSTCPLINWQEPELELGSEQDVT